MKNNYGFFQNTDCEFFPCHKVSDTGSFNCLFCYCPLYALGKNCGGNFSYTPNGIKDCSDCLIPHREGGYKYVIDKFPLIAELAKE